MNASSRRRFGWAVAAVGAAILAGFGACASPSASAPASAALAPAPLAGEWGIQIKFFDHPVDGVLRFSVERHGVIGSFSDDEGNQSELENLRVDGSAITFKLERKNGTLSAKGTIEGTIMSGKMKLRRDEEDAGTGGGGGRGGYGGRRVGEPDTYSWTAIKRAAASETPK